MCTINSPYRLAMRSIVTCTCTLITMVSASYTGPGLRPVDENLLYYEPVHYDASLLHQQHHHKRLTSHHHPLIVKFHAFKRNFSLHLQPDRSSSDIIIVHKHLSTIADLSFLYTGYDTGDLDSVASIAIVNGTLQGTISLSDDSVVYHVAPSNTVFNQSSPFPCVIYRDTDYFINHTQLFPHDPDGSQAIFDQIRNSSKIGRNRQRLRRDERDGRSVLLENDKILENKVCSMKLTADQTLWRHVMMQNNQSESRSMNAIIILITSHLRELNRIFRATKFTIHKNKNQEQTLDGIEFEIKKIVVLRDEDCANAAPEDQNFLCMENINGEALLTNFIDEEIKQSFDFQNYNYDSYDDYEDPTINDTYYGGGGSSFHDDISEYCLSFLFTARILISNNNNPLLGLTLTPEEGKSGGICDANGNKGFVTMFMSSDVNFWPLYRTQLVFVHEVAHSFGARHDNTADCKDYSLMQEPAGGYYLMHSISVYGKPNNRRFSRCSLDKMGVILSQDKHVQCFKKNIEAVCGNGIVEGAETCDCGTSCHLDNCCYAKGQNRSHPELACTLKPKALCSPSQGPCCSPDTCGFIPKSVEVLCHNEQPCVDSLYCDGETYGASCPAPMPEQIRPDDTICQTMGRSRICKAGSCNTSICNLIGWNECQLTNRNDKLTIEEKEELCYVGCSAPDTNECVSTNNDEKIVAYPELGHLLNNMSAHGYHSDSMSRAHGYHSDSMSRAHGYHSDSMSRAIHFPIGTTCNMMTGYCDVFMRCRGVDPDTPLVKLKECITSGECLALLGDIVQQYWYLVLVGFICAIIVLSLFVKCFAVHTKSSNPFWEAKHPHRSVRESVNSMRQSMTMAGGSMRRAGGSMRRGFSTARTSFQRQLSNFSATLRREHSTISEEDKYKDSIEEQELEKFAIEEQELEKLNKDDV